MFKFKILLAISLIIFIYGCSTDSSLTDNSIPNNTQEAVVNETYSKLPFEIDVKEDVNKFLVTLKENPNEITSLYKGIPLFDYYNKYYEGPKIVPYPIYTYIEYIFLTKFSELNKSDIKAVITTSHQLYRLFPEASEEEMSVYHKARNKYVYDFKAELELQLSETEIEEIEKLLSDTFKEDQEERKTLFIKKYKKLINDFYPHYLKKIYNKPCDTNCWDRYIVCYYIYNIAEKAKVKPYTAVYGTPYETRNVPYTFTKDSYKYAQFFGYDIFPLFNESVNEWLKKQVPNQQFSEYQLGLIRRIVEEIWSLYKEHIINATVESDSKCYIKLR